MPSFLSRREFSITTSRRFPVNLANSRSSAFRDETKAGQALRWVFGTRRDSNPGPHRLGMGIYLPHFFHLEK